MNEQTEFEGPPDFGWVKLKRGPMTDELLKHASAFRLLTVIALRINWCKPDRREGTQIGETLISPGIAQLTPSAYKVARATLLDWGQVAIGSKKPKTGVATVVRLTDKCIFEIVS